MVVEQISQTISVVVVIQYSVELMNSESSVLDSVLTHAEHYGRVSVAEIIEEQMNSLFSVVVVAPAHLVPVAWEERV